MRFLVFLARLVMHSLERSHNEQEARDSERRSDITVMCECVLLRRKHGTYNMNSDYCGVGRRQGWSYFIYVACWGPLF